MSRQVDVAATCPKYGKQNPQKLFRTVWGERERLCYAVMSDNINMCTCEILVFLFTLQWQ